jgi:hypothetical protein
MIWLWTGEFEFERLEFEEEREKPALEVSKLEYETRRLGKPWYLDPFYLGPISTIAVALVGGLIAPGTNAFNRNILSLRMQRETLAEEAHSLTTLQARLIHERKQLSDQATYLYQTQAELN